MAAAPDPDPARAPSSPFLAWPGWRNLRGTLALSALYGLVFVAVYGGASLVTDRHTWRLPLRLELGPSVPFVPAAATVYLSINLMLGLAPFVFRRWPELLPLFLTLVLETLVAGFLFLLLPMREGAHPVPGADLWGRIYGWADFLNMEHNEFPSLHVALAVTTAAAYRPRCGPTLRASLGVWTVAIVASTLLIRAHDLLDVAGGLALGAAGARAIQPAFESRKGELEARVRRLVSPAPRRLTPRLPARADNPGTPREAR